MPIVIARVLNFLRVEYFTHTSFVFFLGFFATNHAVSLSGFITCLSVILSYHLFYCWINDLADLKIDRTNPSRSVGFLVEGLISPRNFLILSLIQIPILFFMTYMSRVGNASYLFLAIALILMTVYNVYGKKCKFPFITDAAQGASWSAFILYAATLNGSFPSYETFVIALYFFCFITLINGIHGTLRDLHNDQKHGAKTMSLFLGAREISGKFFFPKAIYWYSISWLIPIAALTYLIPLHKQAHIPMLISIISLCNLISFAYFILILYKPMPARHLSYHAFFLFFPIFLSLLPYLPIYSTLIILCSLTITPISLFFTSPKLTCKENQDELSH